MPFSRPTLKELSDQIQTDIASHIGISLPLKKASILSALSYALAGSIHLLYGNLEYTLTQLLPDTAKGTNLDRLALHLGLGRRRQKTKAEGLIRVNGKQGSVIPKGHIFTHESGNTYITVESETISESGFARLKVISNQPGLKVNLKSQSVLSMSTAIKDIEPKALVLNAGIIGGFDDETDEELRQRLLLHVRHPGQGGSQTDYIKWSQEIPGVGNVWVNSDPTTFSILISFLTTDPDFPIPSDKQIEAVHAKLLQKKPLGTRVQINPLEPMPIPIEIEVAKEFLDFQALLEQELKYFFLRHSQPGEKVSVFRISQVIESVLRHSHSNIIHPQSDTLLSSSQISIFGGFKCKPFTQ